MIFHIYFCRIYVDAIINHMTGTWNENVGTAGSTANFGQWHYPAVPYGRNDFNWPHCVIQPSDYANNAHRVSVLLAIEIPTLVLSKCLSIEILIFYVCLLIFDESLKFIR